MEKNGGSVVKVLLEEGGYFYVCGDAKNMAKSVREKLISLIQSVKGNSIITILRLGGSRVFTVSR